MRRTWPFLALAVVTGGAAVLLVARGMKPGERRADPVVPAGSTAKTTTEPILPEATLGTGAETTAPGPEPLHGDWTIEGRVVRERAEPGDLDPTLDPVAGAAIRVRLAPPEKGNETPPPRAPREVTTGRDGKFAAASLPGKTSLEVEVDAPGTALKAIRLELDGGVEGAGRRRDIGDIVLRPACTLVVRLVDPEGAPVTGAKVVISDLGENTPGDPPESPRETLEQGGGEYVADRLPPVHCSVEATAAGWAPSWESVELPREEPLVVKLDEGSSLIGTVRASTGEPIAGATVTSTDSLTYPDAKCETDASGRFQLRGLREGAEEVEATAEGFHRTTTFAGEDEEVEIWLIREAIVEGKVVDEDDGRPVVGASITLHPRDTGEIEATTDARGEFLIRKLLPGAYEVSFDHDDYLPSPEGPWDLESGERLSGVIVRLRRGFTARGTVTDAATGQPIDRASVSAGGEAEVWSGGWSEKSGQFELRGLAPGEYTVRIGARGYLESRVNAHIAPDTADLAFALEKAGSISGRVLDHEGRPLEGLQVFPEAPRDAPQAVASVLWPSRPRSDARGRFVLEGLPPFGDYGVVAVDENLGFRWVTGIAVGSGAEVTGLDIRFPAGGAVRGRVVDDGGRGMEGVSMELEAKSLEYAEPPRNSVLSGRISAASTRSTKTTSDGTYRIENVAAGLYRVSAEAPGWTSREKGPVRIGEGQAVEGMDFVFERGATAAGRVVDGGGLGVAEASIEVYQGGGPKAFVTTNVEGRFVVMGLPAGRGNLYAGKEGIGRASARVTLPSDDILLVICATGKIAGRVEAPGRSAFSRGEVSIQTLREGSDAIETLAWTDEAGRFSASVEPGPSILIVADVPGFAKSELETALAPGERREVVIPLRRGGTIEGLVVTRGSGEPVLHVDVRLEAPDGSRAGLATLHGFTDEDGAFSIEGVPEGPVVMVARHREHRAARSPIQVIAGDTVNARIEIDGGQGLHGRVARFEKPLAGARVAVLRPDGTPAASAVSGAGGLYEVLGLAPGEHEVTIEAAGPGGRPLAVRRRVTVEAGQLTERDLDLGAVLVTGRVLWNGAPAAAVDIAASSLGEWFEDGRTSTDASGEYSLELPGSREIDLHLTADGKLLADIDLVLPEGPGEVRRDIDLGAK